MFFCLALAVVLLYTYVVWYITMYITAEQYLMRPDVENSMCKGAYATDGRYILIDLGVYDDGNVVLNKGFFWIPKWRVNRMLKNLAAQKYGESMVDFDGIQIVSIDKHHSPSPLPDIYYAYEVIVIIPREDVENPEAEPLLLLRRW